MHSILLPYRGGSNHVQTRSILYVWGPAFAAVMVIAIESTRTFSSENTSGWLRPIFEAILGSLSDAGWAEAHHLLRKTGHFAGFGGVCVAFVRAWLWRNEWRAPPNAAKWRWGATLRAILSTAAVAAADELHQTFLPNRTGKASNVVLDTCGGIVACAVLWVLYWRRDCRT